MKKPIAPPKPKAALTSKAPPKDDDAIRETEEFGENTFARAFTAVKKSLDSVAPQKPAAPPKRIRRSR